MAVGRDPDIGINHGKNTKVNERVLFDIILYKDSIKIGYYKLSILHTILRSLISVSQINDGVPDLLISQVGMPVSSSDMVYFINSSSAMVENAVSIDQTGYSSVGTWSSDQYEINGTLAKTSNSSTNYTKIDRPIRIWAADVAAFGINASNYLQATALVYKLSGNSDPAFLAYNTSIIQIFNANDDAATTNIGTTVDIPVLDNDVPSSAIDATSVIITIQPQHGTVRQLEGQNRFGALVAVD
ncbi:MAG: hypothetical protein EOP45_19805, partial [Sphingobacteriaceae bacterium]